MIFGLLVTQIQEKNTLQGRLSAAQEEEKKKEEECWVFAVDQD